VIDYAVHYEKQSGATAAKVFKLKTIDLQPDETVSIVRRQAIRNFTTRAHHPGVHRVDLLVNGSVAAQAAFELQRAPPPG
jgi:hypothetical protein